ncbi:uncharacterized protein I206_105876 [Kwoniella pini CBS 10737]|uniref:RRM domain-containing protein n=1 Tax=Kwoniella pini CBS 10737 TaxID=1296096 RepID=A0A1B9I0E4_9TREE|nr:uncharacterized protein I206_04696 [Kwoniella pini CBS 10737]OCF49009.1 hypothetical protein I206_04696 [Kwoniella pini CBS 10737]
MNTIREINRINERELQLGVKGSWHDEYKDSAYIFVGGLSFELSEGDIITIFSQWGEIIDINLPRDKETGKTKGFGFLMYEDQRSTVLAVDNMNGALVLGRTIRVDHTRNYRQPGKRNDEGQYEEPEEPTYNAMPPILSGSESDESSEEEKDDLDEEDPMASFLRSEKKKLKIKNLTKGEKGKKRKYEGETKEERKKRKEEKKLKKLNEEKEKEKIKIKQERYTPIASTSRIQRQPEDDDDRRQEGRANRDDWRDGKFELEREIQREGDYLRDGRDDIRSSFNSRDRNDLTRRDKEDRRYVSRDREDRDGSDKRERVRDEKEDRYKDRDDSRRYRNDDERDRRYRDEYDRPRERESDRRRTDERDYRR